MLTFKMKLLVLIFLSALGAHAYKYGNYSERSCGSDLSNLWLDVVLVVDTSANMVPENLKWIQATIIDLFGNGTRIGTKYSDPRTTRVSLITYNKDATVVADLNKYQSFSDLSNGVKFSLTSTSIPASYLSMGLSKADDVLTAGRSNNYRNNYQQFVIVFGTKNQRAPDGTSPLNVSSEMQKKGVQIAVVGFSSDDELDYIASGDLYTPIRNKMPNFLVRQVLQVNCFCPQEWVRSYRGTESGVCLKVRGGETWAQAKLTCQNLTANGYLATDFTVKKHRFLQDLVSKYATKTFHIGLSFVNGEWYWEQPAGQKLVPYYQESHQTGFWNVDYPSSTITNTGVMVDTYYIDGWKNINPTKDETAFVCEALTCDTDNYCA